MIIYAYTRAYGFQTLITQGVRNKKSAGNSNIFQPLFLLEMDFYYHSNQEIHRLKEARIHTAYQSIPFDVYKSSMVLFLAEILYKCLKTQETAPELYDFISHSMQILDQLNESISNFHLVFLTKLSRHLGFYPNRSDAIGMTCFDLRDGVFRKGYPNHPHYIPEKYSQIFLNLLDIEFNSMDQLPLSQIDRNVLIEYILEFYQFHQDNLKTVKSYKILKNLFHV